MRKPDIKGRGGFIPHVSHLEGFSCTFLFLNSGFSAGITNSGRQPDFPEEVGRLYPSYWMSLLMIWSQQRQLLMVVNTLLCRMTCKITFYKQSRGPCGQKTGIAHFPNMPGETACTLVQWIRPSANKHVHPNRSHTHSIRVIPMFPFCPRLHNKNMTKGPMFPSPTCVPQGPTFPRFILHIVGI